MESLGLKKRGFLRGREGGEQKDERNCPAGHYSGVLWVQRGDETRAARAACLDSRRAGDAGGGGAEEPTDRCYLARPLGVEEALRRVHGGAGSWLGFSILRCKLLGGWVVESAP